jgi:hypothetical protein
MASAMRTFGCHISSPEFNQKFGSDLSSNSKVFPSFIPKSMYPPLGYKIEHPKGVFQPYMGASVTYDFLWDDFAGDIAFPTGSSP